MTLTRIHTVVAIRSTCMALALVTLMGVVLAVIGPMISEGSEIFVCIPLLSFLILFFCLFYWTSKRTIERYKEVLKSQTKEP